MRLEHRIRSAAVVTKNDTVLLVKHKDPVTGFEFWVPPGGGLEEGENIYDCARREAYEETGLAVELGWILYLREYIETSQSRHHFEVFILATSFSGELTTANVSPTDPDFAWIKEVRFLSKREMKGLNVFPDELKEKLWQDLASGKELETRYLGQQRENHPLPPPIG